MKKKTALVAATLVVVMCLAIVLTACNFTYAGTYEMESISGTITVNGETTRVNKNMYEYYRLILKFNGKAIVESKGALSGGTSIEAEGKWKYEDGKILLKSGAGQFATIEEMDIEGDTITYKINQSVTEGYQSMTINVVIVLKKA